MDFVAHKVVPYEYKFADPKLYIARAAAKQGSTSKDRNCTCTLTNIPRIFANVNFPARRCNVSLHVAAVYRLKIVFCHDGRRCDSPSINFRV